MIGRIQKAGWVYSHTTESHRHFHHPTLPGIVPCADHIELAKGAEADIERQAGVE